MRYIINQRWWSRGSTILDAAQRPIYTVNGKAFSWSDQLSFQDVDGNELAFIKQELWSFTPRYRIYRDGALFGEVTKTFRWFQREFRLDVPGPNDYVIEGRFWRHEYTFHQADRVIAHVSRAFFSLPATYGVDIVDGEDDVAVLCTAIVIDQVARDESQASAM